MPFMYEKHYRPYNRRDSFYKLASGCRMLDYFSQSLGANGQQFFCSGGLKLIVDCWRTNYISEIQFLTTYYLDAFFDQKAIHT